MTWLMRMARWVRHPPSMLQVKIVAAVIFAVIAIVVIDKLGYWPEWARLNPKAMRAIRP
ncbi:hypothetical protein [uncultured Thioclava sp.]|jgi:hypothetical protein|nr:hypothetical protein [uncultured Thioclava sp.]